MMLSSYLTNELLSKTAYAQNGISKREMFDLRNSKFRGGAILIRDGKILLLKGNESGLWGIPKGKPKRTETELQTAMRETIEETGCIPGKFILYRRRRGFLILCNDFFGQPKLSREHTSLIWVKPEEVLNMKINGFTREMFYHALPKLEGLLNA